MKRYPKYKDSGIKWIGEIPEHWVVRRLKFCLTLISQKTFPNSNLKYIGMENIESWSGNYIESSIETDGQANIFQKGDILFGKLRPYLAKVHLADFGGCCSSELLVYRSKINNNKYLQKFLITKGFIELIDASTYGAKMPRANSLFIGNQLLTIPPLPEQQSIVAFLEKETANIDAYIKQREHEISVLEELKQAEIANAVTKGLNPDAKMKDSGIDWIGEIPEHWKCERIGSIYIENKHINSDLSCNEAYKFNYGSLVRKDVDVNLEEVADVYSKYTVITKNDIIINGLNLNYDFVTQRVAVVEKKGIITSAYVAITPREGVNSDYFGYLFKSMDAKKIFNGMGTGIRLTLGYSELKKQQIPIPPKDEQDLIVKNIKEKTAKIESYISLLKSEIERMHEYKQRLISDAVTGKIKVQNVL
ncbi:MAG: restriction endonuclease subunit S [Rikenellaceae bacterium]|jgi:type I restriction enzyme S subunit